MVHFNVRGLALAALMAGFVPLGSACYVEEDVPPPAYAEGYQPQFYDGYVVYYDDVGRPYYYNNGAVFWVPATSPLYIGYVNHWHAYGPAYRSWYGHYGYRYRGYRAGGRYHR
jgi:hypothetical protein